MVFEKVLRTYRHADLRTYGYTDRHTLSYKRDSRLCCTIMRCMNMNIEHETLGKLLDAASLSHRICFQATHNILIALTTNLNDLD